MDSRHAGTATEGVDIDGVPYIDGRLTLRDERVVAWRWWGAVGPTIVRLSGSTSCRLSGAPLLWQAMRVRVLAIDRPGFGYSTRKPGRGVRLVADDLAHLLDALELEVVAVVGHSAGGPHALAMAGCHGERVSRMSIVSGGCHLNSDERARVVKANRDAAAAAERGWEALHSYLVELREELLRGAVTTVLADVVDADMTVIGDPDRNERERQIRVEALRQGAEGWADESLAIMGDWDFDLDAVRAHVRWFHGSDDNTVPISAARRLAQRLPNCDFVELHGRGHRTLAGRTAIQDVLTA